MRPLTKRQEEVFDLIRHNIEETGVPPTRIEIADKLGFRSANAAEEHIKAIAKKGFIEIIPGVSRGIRIPHLRPNNQMGLPLVGRVAAGEPILAQEHVETNCQVDPTLFKPKADFLLRVQGDSMRDIGILSNDLLVVHKSHTAETGQVVVARVGDEVTVKRLRQDGDIVHLIAENPDFPTIKVDLNEQPFSIEGIAVGIIRNASWL